MLKILEYLDWYVLIINAIGFMVFSINNWLLCNTDDKAIDKVVTIVSILGGSLGIILAILILDWKSAKETMMSRVFVSTIVVIQFVLYLVLKGYFVNTLDFNIIGYLKNHELLLIYLLIMNVITFFLFAIDKRKAIKHKNRIRIVTLLVFSYFGGSIGALLAMYIFHHKTKKDYFAEGEIFIVAMQIIVLLYVMNTNWNFHFLKW